MIWLALILPGVIVAYVLFLRPVLRALPQMKAFYADADGFWQKAWALCGKSLTLAFSYGVQAVGVALQWIDPIADMVGDPDLRTQITNTLQANPKALGYVLMMISAITIAARLRSIAKGS
jgi:hypothetical protein